MFNRTGRTLHHVVLAEHRPRPSGSHSAVRVCGNRECVELEHLEWQSPAERAEGRKRNGTEVFGERNGRARLTAADVREIRRLAAEGMRHREIAERYGVTRSNVTNIVARRRWPHI